MKKVIVISILLVLVSSHLWASVGQTMYFQVPCSTLMNQGDYSNINVTISCTPSIVQTSIGNGLSFFEIVPGVAFMVIDLTDVNYGSVTSGDKIDISLNFKGMTYKGTYCAGDLDPVNGSDFYMDEYGLQVVH